MLTFKQFISEARYTGSNGKPVTVAKNPSGTVAARIVMNSKERFARYYAHGDGHIHMWSGDHDLTHHDFMKQHGVPTTSDNYAGAGVVHSLEDARRTAENNAHARRENKKKLTEGLSNKIGKVVKKLQGKTNPRISVKPGKARLQKQIDRLDFNPRDELQKKLEKFRTDKLNEHLLVAIKDGDKIHVGKPGEIHAEVARRENLIRTHQTHIDGFVPHDDHKHFMDREQALDHVKNNDPKTFSKLKKGIPGLESDSYDDAGGRIRRKY